MTHSRKTLRDAAKTALSGAVAGAKDVRGVRGYDYSAGQLPVVEVSTPDMTDNRISDDGDIERTYSLEVRIIATQREDIEDAMDAMAEDVEAAIYGMGGDWQDAISLASSAFEAGSKGQEIPATLTTVFTVRAYADEADPQQT